MAGRFHSGEKGNALPLRNRPETRSSEGESMPRIEQSVMIDAPVERVYAIARDVESFPDYMEDLQSIKVLERSEDGNRTITEWVGLVRQFRMTLKWTQEDLWN